MAYACFSRAPFRWIRYLMAPALLNGRERVVEEDFEILHGSRGFEICKPAQAIALQYCKTAVLDYALKRFAIKNGCVGTWPRQLRSRIGDRLSKARTDLVEFAHGWHTPKKGCHTPQPRPCLVGNCGV